MNTHYQTRQNLTGPLEDKKDKNGGGQPLTWPQGRTGKCAGEH